MRCITLRSVYGALEHFKHTAVFLFLSEVPQKTKKLCVIPSLVRLKGTRAPTSRGFFGSVACTNIREREKIQISDISANIL